MGYQKEENVWVSKPSAFPRSEYAASNHADNQTNEENEGNAKEEIVDVVEASCYEMHNETPPLEMNRGAPTYDMNNDSQAHDMSALIAYEAPMYRGEPLSSFEKQMLDMMDTFSTDQRVYYEMTKARFQHLDHQIKGVQEQHVELYYREN